MIIPMLKYSFLVYHGNYPEFLKEIKKIGVVHIEQKSAEPTAEMQEKFRNIGDVSRVISILEQRLKWIKDTPYPISIDEESDLLEKIKSFEHDLESLRHTATALEKDIRQAEPWGVYSKETIEKLSEAGLDLRFMICPIRKFEEEWLGMYPIGIVSDYIGYRYFVLFEDKNDPSFETVILPGVDEIAAPEKSLQELKLSLEENKKALDNVNSNLDAAAYYGITSLKQYKQKLQSEFDMANVWHQTESEVEGKVQIVEGWVPKPNAEELDNYLKENSVVAITREPQEEEKVPVKLKNNKFTRLFEQIGDFYDLPNHAELDLTPFFAPFYMLYFGIALGDAGYGLIVFLVSTFAKLKMPKFKKAFSLGQYLGIATMIFGSLTGSFFGLEISEFGIPFLENLKDNFITNNQLFYLSLILGGIQILFGMFIKVVNISITQGFRYAFSTIGWLILIFGMGSTYLLSSNNIINNALAGNLYMGVGIISGILIMILNHPKRNIFLNFAMGIWDIYGMVTGLLGDMLSYVRLFALGISGGILASVFNMMAVSMKPDIPVLGFIIMLIILLAGHGITLVMSGIGAFVHPIRLTFVEFYKNAGFEGGGMKYSPFAEKTDVAVNKKSNNNN